MKLGIPPSYSHWKFEEVLNILYEFLRYFVGVYLENMAVSVKNCQFFWNQYDFSSFIRLKFLKKLAKVFQCYFYSQKGSASF